MAERKWIDWQPKAGDIKPKVYQIKVKHGSGKWKDGACSGDTITQATADFYYFRVPYRECVVKQAEYRPPWIDPQCKFRWGDRVKDRQGNIWFINNPWDMPKGTSIYPVLCTKFLWDAPPYSCYRDLSCDYNIFNEEDLTLFHEDLPKHFDDRILDADQPQEAVNQQPARVPREIWVNTYPGMAGGAVHETRETADIRSATDQIECIHFREVL